MSLAFTLALGTMLPLPGSLKGTFLLALVASGLVTFTFSFSIRTPFQVREIAATGLN